MVLSRNKVNAVLLYMAVFLFLIRMLLYSVSGSWILSYENFYSYQAGGRNLGTTPASVGILFILLLYNARFLLRRKDIFWVLLCILPFAFWSILEYGNGEGINVWFGSVPTTPCILPLFFLLGREESLSKHFKKAALILTAGYLLLSLYSALDFYLSVGWGNRILYMPGKTSLSMGMLALWVYLFSDLDKKESNEEVGLKIGLILLALLCSILIVSRSWIIQSLLLFTAYLIISLDLKGKIMTIMWIVLIALAVVFLLESYLSNIILPLIEKAEEDTRSGQFYDFFGQISSWKLLVGSGMQATYVFSGIEYRYFDNQFIFESFHYGCLHLLPLFWFLFRTLRIPVEKIKDIGRRKSYLGAKFVIITFLLAMGGLSVYYRYDYSIPTALFLMFVGKHSVLPDTKIN